jgi:hypothetical protein
MQQFLETAAIAAFEMQQIGPGNACGPLLELAGASPAELPARCSMPARLTFPRFAMVAAAAFLLPDAATVAAQSAPASRCRLVCAPSLTLMPGVVRTHLLRGPLVRDAATGAETRLPGSSSFELIFALSSRTVVPRLSVFASAQWLPNATEGRNPFTLYTASDLGTHVRANAPTLVAGGSLALVAPPQTAGWFDAAFNAGDLFSQAARPDDRSAYTHKLDLDLVTHLHVFSRLPDDRYLHGVSLFGILDYVATGLPSAGDEVPRGRVFVSDARPMAAVAGLAFPLTSAAQ